MKTLPVVLLALTALSTLALAHDPSQHKEEKARLADCSQMMNMDMSQMDPNDPVMRALHEKCRGQMQRRQHGGDNMKRMPGMDEHDTPSGKEDKE